MTQVGTEMTTQGLARPLEVTEDSAAGATVQKALGRRRHFFEQHRASHFDWLHWAGIALLLAQGVTMLIWSTLLWQRFALTSDYAVYHQAWWLIAHGHFDPLNSTQNHSFWRNDMELLIWPLALLGVVFPHGPVLLYVQDVALVVAELVAWQWIATTVAMKSSSRASILPIAGLIVLLGNPWAWWVVSFDVHMEVIGLPFVMLAAYELAHKGRRRLWVWVFLSLLSSTVVATYVAGLGLGSLATRRWRYKGATLFGVGVGWTLVVALAHLDKGAPPNVMYGYLAGKQFTDHASLSTLLVHIASHPGVVAAALWAHRVDIWANVSPPGLLGVLDPLVLGACLPALLANELIRGYIFGEPLFQSVVVYVAVPVGTVLVLGRLYRRVPRLAVVLAVVVACNTIGWAFVWLPRVERTWLNVVPPGSAAALARAEAMIPTSAEVVTSNGVMGRFSDHVYLYQEPGPGGDVPVRAPDVWWVIAPAVGIDLVPAEASDALVAALAGPMHAQLIMHRGGIWVFRWLPSRHIHNIRAPSPASGSVPAWSFGGPSGVAVLSGPSFSWHLGSDGSAGYVLDKDYWLEPPGLYRVTVTLASSVPTYVEVWNATGDVLLTRRELPPTNALSAVSVTVNARQYYRPKQFTGWGPFRALFVPPPSEDQLEVTIWSPGSGVVEVKGVEVGPAR